VIAARGLAKRYGDKRVFADIDLDGIPEIVLASGFANEAKNSVGIVSVLHHDGDPRSEWKVTVPLVAESDIDPSRCRARPTASIGSA